MRLIISATLILSVIAAVTFGEAQYYQHPNSPFMFPGYPGMLNRNHQQDSRLFFSGLFTTFTYTVSTVTSTAIATTITTCTTSSATLTTCTAGRKRRDAHGVFRNRRGLLYEEKEEEGEEQNISLPFQHEASSESDVARSPRQMEVQPAIPFSIQPTFGAYYAPEMGYNNIPSAVPLSRIFLAFGTATVTITSTSTSTSKLTAACSSTTSYSTCTS